MSAEQVHKATLTILAFSTADVMTVEELEARVQSANRVRRPSRGMPGSDLRGSRTDYASGANHYRHLALPYLVGRGALIGRGALMGRGVLMGAGGVIMRGALIGAGGLIGRGALKGASGVKGRSWFKKGT
jgi:hypothetical protein